MSHIVAAGMERSLLLEHEVGMLRNYFFCPYLYQSSLCFTYLSEREFHSTIQFSHP